MHQVKRLFGYDDAYYAKKAAAKDEELQRKELERKETERWLKKMQKKEKSEEAEAAAKERKKKKSKLQVRLGQIRDEAQAMEDEHEENIKILKDTIEAYTHLPEVQKYVKNVPAHQVENSEDELHPSHKDSEKYVEREGYRDDNIPNPWWKVRGVKTRKCDKELTWDEVKKLYNYDFVPGHFHQYRGSEKIYGFPPTAAKEKAKQKLQRMGQESRYQWSDKEQAYARNGFGDNVDGPLNLTYADNNRRDEAYEKPSQDGIADAIYRWRTAKVEYPETKLLPSAEQLKVAAAQMSRSKARMDYPDFKFRRHKIDMSRLRVRKYFLEDGGGSPGGGSEYYVDGDGSSIGGKSSLTNVSVVDVKLPRYSSTKHGDHGSVVSGMGPDDVTAASSTSEDSLPQLHWNGKPIIRHNMAKPMLSMKELTTLGLGGKAGPYHPGVEEKPKDGLAAKLNNGMRNDIDIAFSTDKAKIIADANVADVALDAVEVYHRVGDLYVLENKSAMSRRSDFEEDSLSLGRQKVAVKLKRHRGALGLDKFHFSRKNKLSLESKSTKRERRIERQGQKELKNSLNQVEALVDKIKEEEDAKAEEKRREMHRQGMN